MIGRRGPPSTQEPDKPLGFDDFDLRLGDVMRGERATIGKSLLDVQRELKIKATYIAAIENCDVGAFETPGFIAGYVRSYARYLGMDPEWTYKRFCEEADFRVAHGMSTAAVRRSPTPERSPAAKKPRNEARDPLASAGFAPQPEPWLSRIEPGAVGSLAVLVALIGALGYGGWAVLQEVQRVQLSPVDDAPGVMADLDPLSDVDGPGAPDMADSGVSVSGGDAFDRLYRPQALDEPVMVARDGPISAIRPGSLGALAGDEGRSGPDGLAELDAEAERVAAEVAARAGGVADEGGQAQVGDNQTVQVVEAGPPKVEILAVRPSWVRVRGGDGTVLFEKILDAGERYEIPQTEQPPTLRAGNSGSVYFVVDGETYGPSAPGANIADNVNLSAEGLRDAYTLADLDSDPDLANMVDMAEAGDE